MEKEFVSMLKEDHTYTRISDHYDLQIKLYNLLWQFFGFKYEFWRKKAIESLGLIEGNTVLDLGCGSGLNFDHLYNLVGSKGKIFGTDISEKMIFLAQKKLDRNSYRNISLTNGNMDSFDVFSNYDAIISTYAIEYSTNPKKVIQKAYHSLNLGGKLVLLSFKNDNLSFCTKLFLLFWLKCIKDFPKTNQIPDGKIIRESINQYFPESLRVEYFGGLVCLDIGIKK